MQIYYILKCTCKWWRKCLGTTESLKDLVEFKPCTTCHGPRKFKCPKCGKIVKAVRAEYPDPPEEPITVPSLTLSMPVLPPLEIEVPALPIPEALVSPPIPPVVIETKAPLAVDHPDITALSEKDENVLTDASMEMARTIGRFLAQRYKEVKNADIQEKK